MIYRYFPRGMALPKAMTYPQAKFLPGGGIDEGPGVLIGDPRYDSTEEHCRLVEARIRAGTGEDYAAWRAMLARMRTRFPDCSVMNWSFHLAGGTLDSAYSAEVHLPSAAPDKEVHLLGVMVSFIVPYFAIYSERFFWLEPDRHRRLRGRRHTPIETRFELSAEEEPYAQGLGEEIATTYGYELMPPEVGRLLVPDVETGLRLMGEASIYECLFSEHRGRACDEPQRGG